MRNNLTSANGGSFFSSLSTVNTSTASFLVIIISLLQLKLQSNRRLQSSGCQMHNSLHNLRETAIHNRGKQGYSRNLKLGDIDKCLGGCKHAQSKF